MKQHRLYVLPGGNAPACWQRELTRQTSKLESLQRLCIWLRPFIETRPKLRKGPLLGDCLTELTGQAVQSEESNAETSHLRRDWWSSGQDGRTRNKRVFDQLDERFAQPQSNMSIRKSSTKPPRKKLSYDDPSQPIELNRQVSQVLLTRLAGEAPKNTGEIKSARRLNRQMTKLPDKSISPINNEVNHQRDWFHSVSRRAGRSIGLTGTAATTLDDQWAFNVDGKAAPWNLLIRWLEPLRKTGNGTRSKHQMMDKAKPHQPLSSEPGQHHELPGAVIPVISEKGEVDREWVASEHINPPLVANSLPHLISPRAANEPSPHLASSIDRQASRREMTQAEDDLAHLAASVQRILNEEARRHGIDV